MTKKKVGTKGTLDKTLYTYVVFLFIFSAMITVGGLNDLIAIDVDIEPPQAADFTAPNLNSTNIQDNPCFNPFDGEIASKFDALFSVSFTGSRLGCLSTALPTPITDTFRVIDLVLANMVFFFKLMLVKPEIGLLGTVIFGPAIVMVLMWIIKIIRGN